MRISSDDIRTFVSANIIRVVRTYVSANIQFLLGISSSLLGIKKLKYVMQSLIVLVFIDLIL